MKTLLAIQNCKNGVNNCFVKRNRYHNKSKTAQKLWATFCVNIF